MLPVGISNDRHQCFGPVITKNCTLLSRVQTTGLNSCVLLHGDNSQTSHKPALCGMWPSTSQVDPHVLWYQMALIVCTALDSLNSHLLTSQSISTCRNLWMQDQQAAKDGWATLALWLPDSTRQRRSKFHLISPVCSRVTISARAGKRTLNLIQLPLVLNGDYVKIESREMFILLAEALVLSSKRARF